MSTGKRVIIAGALYIAVMDTIGAIEHPPGWAWGVASLVGGFLIGWYYGAENVKERRALREQARAEAEANLAAWKHPFYSDDEPDGDG